MADRDPELAAVLLVDLGPGAGHGRALSWDDIAETVGRYTGRAYAGPAGSVVALFPIPGDAVRCGDEVGRVSGARGCVHVGEVASDGRTAHGPAVDVALHHVATAGPGDVVVTRTVTELCAGSGLRFREHGRSEPGDDAGTYLLDRSAATASATRAAPGPPEAARPPGPRMVVVDDHPLWRQTLAKVIETRRVGRVVGQAGDAATAVAMVEEHRPDVVIMDVHLPDESGVAATRRIVGNRPDTRVLMLSSSDEPEDVLAAVDAGASGYLLKTAESRDIAEAVKRVASGELVFPPALATVVLDALRARARPS